MTEKMLRKVSEREGGKLWVLRVGKRIVKKRPASRMPEPMVARLGKG